MLTYRVEDMTCGHCVGAITRAVRAADPGAKIEVDLGQHLVRIESVEAEDRKLMEAITEAGYTPVPVEPQQASAVTQRTGSCCCAAAGSTGRG